MEDGLSSLFFVMFANFRYQFTNVVMRKVFPAPFLIVEGLSRNQGEKPQRIHWT